MKNYWIYYNADMDMPIIAHTEGQKGNMDDQVGCKLVCCIMGQVMSSYHPEGKVIKASVYLSSKLAKVREY